MLTSWRPWGPFDWVVGKMPDVQWGIIGTLSTEDRCVAAVSAMDADRLGRQLFFHIHDPDTPVTEPFNERHEEMRAALLEAGCADGAFTDVPLLSPLDTVQMELNAFLEQAGENVILDITSMPKRWFFPLVKLLSRNPDVRRLLVTYTSAESYGRTLSSNPEPLRTLPGFASDDARVDHEVAIVGIGFEPLGLNELYREHNIEKFRYVFPFPPGPPGFHRNWAFVRTLDQLAGDREASEDSRWHIDMHDCSTAFDVLLRATRNGKAKSVLAPYGPKPTSLAMCLFANAVDAAGLQQTPVYYAQPRRYAIDYSTGVKTVHNRPDIQAYCIKIDGIDLYNII